jgi:hypothetical protein
MLLLARRSLPVVLLVALGVAARAQTSSSRAEYLPFSEAQPVLQALDEIVPPELKGRSERELASMWPDWVKERDADTRGRLAAGEEDSLANLLLFGTSYTRQPRLTPEVLTATQGKTEEQKVLVQGRIVDMVRGLASPQGNERLQFMRHFLEGRGYRFQSPTDRERVAQYLIANLRRVLQDADSYKQTLEAAHSLNDPSEEFARRSTLFEKRGISLDTSLMPNLALEGALKQIQARGLLAPGSVRRVGIIGPGLDFIDKSSGYDFYPQQTIQPFALIDTLLRLGLARPGNLEVTTFDISSRVNHHLERARARARRGQPYIVQLPRDTQRQWTAEATRYWQHFGTMIGTSVPPLQPPAVAGKVQVRAVSILPTIVQKISPVDLNVVWQQLALPADKRFDLLVGTNIFVYYGVFEQSLAMVNMARMMHPGGFLLSNNELLDLPQTPLHIVNYTTTPYSDLQSDGDHIVWYQRAAQ